MIIAIVIPFVAVFIGYLVSLVPANAVPDLSNLPTVAGQLAGYVGSLSNWLPGYVLGPCLAFVFACFTTAVVVRFARLVIAHVPFIGGDSGG